MAAGLSTDLDRWRREFDELMLRVGARFARVGPRRMAPFVRGLLAGLPRVSCWSIAEPPPRPATTTNEPSYPPDHQDRTTGWGRPQGREGPLKRG